MSRLGLRAKRMDYVKRKIELTDKQSRAHFTFWKSTTDALACSTGFGGGKSFLLAAEVAFTAGMYPGAVMMVASPTYPQMKRTIWRSLIDVIPRANIAHVNNGDFTLTLDFSDGEKEPCTVFCVSGSVPVQNWQGANLAQVFIDEADGITDAHYRQCWARLRMKDMPNKMLIATNPPPNDHWLPRDFYFKPRKGFRLLQWGSYGNPHTGERFLRLLKDTYKGEERTRAYYGRIGVAFAGQFFDNYRPAIHMISEHLAEKIRKASKYKIYGLDFGYVNPFALIELCWWEKHECWVLTRELYQSRLNTEEKAELLKRTIHDIDNATIYADHDAQERADLESIYGIYTIAARKQADKEESKRTGVVSSLHHLKHHMNIRANGTAGMYINTACVWAIREIESFRFAKDPNLCGPNGEPVFIEDEFEGANHAIDACFHKDEPVLEETKGWVPISSISAGDRILTPNGFETVQSGGCIGKKQLVELEFDDGSKITCTPDHRFIIDAYRYASITELGGYNEESNSVVKDFTKVQRQSFPAVCWGTLYESYNQREAEVFAPLCVGKEAWENTEGLSCASQEPQPTRQQAGEFRTSAWQETLSKPHDQRTQGMGEKEYSKECSTSSKEVAQKQGWQELAQKAWQEVLDKQTISNLYVHRVQEGVSKQNYAPRGSKVLPSQLQRKVLSYEKSRVLIKITKKEVDDVYCVEVPTGFFVMKNGMVAKNCRYALYTERYLGKSHIAVDGHRDRAEYGTPTRSKEQKGGEHDVHPDEWEERNREDLPYEDEEVLSMADDDGFFASEA